MATSHESLLETLRQPEYIGENRCIPCTAVNVVISAILAALFALVAWELGLAAFAVFLAAIYLRGYLVPGTPTLTKRYFPDRVLRWFDKAPEPHTMGDAEVEVDAERTLLELELVEFTPDGADLQATESFRAEWHDERDALEADGDALLGRLADLIDADSEHLSIYTRGEGAVVRENNLPVAQWESTAALRADMAAVPALASRHPEWNDLSIEVQGRLLNGLRVFLETCPDCGGEVGFSRDTVESCCREYEVIAMSCTECEALLLEVEAA